MQGVKFGDLVRRLLVRHRHAPHRLIRPHLVYAVDFADTPAGDERRGEGRLAQIDGDGVIDDSPACRTYGPAVGPAVLVEPGVYTVDTLSEAAGRNRDDHARWEAGGAAALGLE